MDDENEASLMAAGPSVESSTSRQVLSIDEALALAVEKHRMGSLEEARIVYEAILEKRPDHPAALHFYGILMHQSGDSQLAVDLMRRSIELEPGNPGAYNNLGNVLLESGDIEQAVEAYRRCLDMAPDFVETLSNLGTIHRARGDWDAAEAAYARAIELRPDFAEAHCNMANLRFAQGRTEEAGRLACQAIACKPDDIASRKLLAMVYYQLGQIDEAAAVYQDWLAKEPDNPVARHHLAACTGQDVPTRAENAYIEATFDDFASSFDANLEGLNYRAPELVAQAVARAYPGSVKVLQILDAGCGTGLCGPLLAVHAAHLVGVDLSGQMLDKAAARKVYDELVKVELTNYLEAVPTRFDLIVSADTLCYFGYLEGILRAAYTALRDEGRFIFTVEEADADTADYLLKPHGRYSHARGYVEGALLASGFVEIEIGQVVLRNECGRQVAGLILAAKKPRTA